MTSSIYNHDSKLLIFVFDRDLDRRHGQIINNNAENRRKEPILVRLAPPGF
jgi:hypothetical protein